ncbi:phosphatase PAP2 family protein [Pedobacter soli]|uniref:PAP2 superfamily protein n=1 Tax=Pedobacter soli TaxID=390242 RepID=A0A1G7B996_9SPHI|nr:phosphatase PAP2 family protein [Pedobacter soli]SDE23694.1 PAP2 superfamily protein [Pedobacter soli]
MEKQPGTKGFYHRSFVYAALSVSAGYLLLSKFLVGFKTDQLVLVFIFNALFFFSKATRKFILGFSIFIVYWILFDYMKAFPNYRYNMVHIQDLYEAEKHVFGISLHGLIVTPNEFWKANSSAFLDVLTGLFYLMWVPVPLAFAVYLFFKKKTEFVHFSLVFVWVNLLGFVVYYLFPAAPPWYVQTHGFNFIAGTPGNTAGLARFDQFFNITLFKGIYSKGSNVFAAMPSLHSSYPLIVVYYTLKNKLGGINIFFITVMVGIWFSAVYSSHHYCLDVLAGISCAILGIVSFQFLVKKAPLKHFVAYMVQKIA